MELRDLKALVTVARSGSFTAAAAELGYTQSAVSQQIQSLEQEVGRVLLERRPVRPTAAGARLVEHASRILMRLDVARSELVAIDQDRPHLRVSACPLAAPASLAAALRLVRKASPLVQITVRAATAAAAIAAVSAGEADVALVDGVTTPEGPLALSEPGLLRTAGLMEERLLVALPTAHPLAGRRWIDLSMLSDAPWVTSEPVPFDAGADRPSGAERDQPFVVHEPTDLILLLNLVAADHGSALVPASVPILPPGVITVPLRQPTLVHRAEVLTLRDPPPMAAAAVTHLRNLARARIGLSNGGDPWTVT